MFKISEDIETLGNPGTVVSERCPRQLFHRLDPLDFVSGRNGGWPHQGTQAGCNHDLEVPLRQQRIGILPVQHLALLGDADVSGEIAYRLRQNRRVCRAATPSHGSTATMKKAQLQAALARHAIERTVRLVQFPSACKHSTVFIRVGIPQHDLLPTMPGRQQSFVFTGGPHLLHYLRGVAQCFN